MPEFYANPCAMNASITNSHTDPTSLSIVFFSKSQKVRTCIIIESQVKTQKSSKRPYGVGLLIAGIDSNGPHLFETCPSGNYYEYEAYSIGARSQSARTYLEDNFETFKEASLKELIFHSLKALKKSASEEGEVKASSVEIGVVGRDSPFRLLKESEIEEYLKDVEKWQCSQMDEEK